MTTTEPTFRKNRKGELLVWLGPTKEWVEDETDPYFGYERQLDPDLVFTREQANEIVVVLLQGPEGPVGMMGPAGLNAN